MSFAPLSQRSFVCVALRGLILGCAISTCLANCAPADDLVEANLSDPSDRLTPAVVGQNRPPQTLNAQLQIDSDRNQTAAVPADYWVVSSRRTVQHRLHRGQIELDYFAADVEGNLSPADAFAMNASLIPGVPVCIFVHGSFTEWQSTTAENVDTNKWIRGAVPDRPLQIIFYSWPSDGPYLFGTPSPMDVSIRGVQAEFNGLHLGHLLSVIPQECPVCLVGHSHGARAVASTLHLLGGGAIQGYALRGVQPHRYRVVFAAAAIDHNWLNPHQAYGCALHAPEMVLNLRNCADLPLRFYPLHRPCSAHALAITGFTPWDRHQMGPLAAKVADADITDLVGQGHVWPFYMRRPEIAAIMAPFVYFLDGQATGQ